MVRSGQATIIVPKVTLTSSVFFAVMMFLVASESTTCLGYVSIAWTEVQCGEDRLGRTLASLTRSSAIMSCSVFLLSNSSTGKVDP